MRTSALSGPRAGFSTAALAASALVFAGSAARAQQGFVESLPEHTLVYVAAPDLDSWWKGFQTSAVFKIWQEEEVQEFLADLMAEGQKYYKQYMGMAKQMHANGQMPVDPEKLTQIRLKGISFAITDLVVPGGQKPAMVSAVGCIDFGSSGKIAQEAFGVLNAMVEQQAGQQFLLETKSVGDCKLRMIRPPEQEPVAAMMPTFGITWGFVGNRLVFGTDVKRVEKIATALTSGEAPSGGLPNNEMYRRVANRVSAGNSDLKMYARPDAMIDVAMAAGRMATQMNPNMAEELDMDGVSRVVDTLGLRAMKAIGIASGYTNGKGFFKSFMICPEQERKGLTKMMSAGSVNLERLGWVPKEVGSFSVASMGNLENIVTTMMSAVSSYDEGVGKLAESKMREAEQALEMNFKKDIFGAFGPELVYYSMPVTGLMATPEMVFMLQCKNKDRTLEVLKKMCQLSDGVVSINDSQTENGTFHTIDLVLDDMGMGMDPTGMLDPTFAFGNGFLVFGMSRSDVKTALKRFKGGADAANVRANPAFKPYLGMIPEKVSSLSFSDVASEIDGVYGTLSGVLGMVPIPPDIPVDLGLLPSVDTLTKHLFGSVSWSTEHKDGFAAESIGPFGPEIAVAGIGVAVGAVAFFTVARNNPRVRRIGR